MLERIPELRLIHETIHHLDVRLLLLEGPEHPVPDDEDPGVILVQTVSVGAVMHLVVAGGVEDVVQGAQAGHKLGVDPELVEEVELRVHLVMIFFHLIERGEHQHDGCWNGKGQRKVKPVGEPGQTLQYWLSGYQWIF